MNLGVLYEVRQLPPFCRMQPLHDAVNEAISKGHEDDMSMSLKFVSNAAQPSSMKVIMKFLTGSVKYPDYIEADAVLALAQIAKKDPRKVSEVKTRHLSFSRGEVVSPPGTR